MAKLNWSTEALAWLEEIHGYVATDNPIAAGKVVDGIVQRAEQLQQFPDTGSLLRREADAEIRMLLYGHYRIACLHDAAEDAVHILGVFHGALDIDRYLP